MAYIIETEACTYTYVYYCVLTIVQWSGSFCHVQQVGLFAKLNPCFFFCFRRIPPVKETHHGGITLYRQPSGIRTRL